MFQRRRAAQRLLAMALPLLATNGCVTVTLPLCPAVARNSYSLEEMPSPLNRMILEQAEVRGIAAQQLSWFAAEYKGFSRRIASFEQEYRFMLCAFDPDHAGLLQADV